MTQLKDQLHWELQARPVHEIWRALTPQIWDQVNSYGRFELDMHARMPL
jgi:hypothetical protein